MHERLHALVVRLDEPLALVLLEAHGAGPALPVLPDLALPAGHHEAEADDCASPTEGRHGGGLGVASRGSALLRAGLLCLRVEGVHGRVGIGRHRGRRRHLAASLRAALEHPLLAPGERPAGALLLHFLAGRVAISLVRSARELELGRRARAHAAADLAQELDRVLVLLVVAPAVCGELRACVLVVIEQHRELIAPVAARDRPLPVAGVHVAQLPDVGLGHVVALPQPPVVGAAGERVDRVAGRVVHDGTVVVRLPLVRLAVDGVLRNPVVLDVLPLDLDVLSAVRPLVLMRHAQDVVELVQHVPQVIRLAARLEVDRAFLRAHRQRVARWTGPAARAGLVDHDQHLGLRDVGGGHLGEGDAGGVLENRDDRPDDIPRSGWHRGVERVGDRIRT
mmetsp:Transcript_22172/g.66101  ORF Transcript_22172/g.66101 Transcript_22172/m.66101 type:complete len:394 (-) Transcript_22172:257-1438(-)